MPYIKTDILCDGKIWLPETDVQIHENKPSAYDKQTFISGRIELPAHFQINFKSMFAIKTPDGNSEEITLTNLGRNDSRVELRFNIKKPVSIEFFLPLESI